jgi:hypothetical protein
MKNQLQNRRLINETDVFIECQIKILTRKDLHVVDQYVVDLGINIRYFV